MCFRNGGARAICQWLAQQPTLFFASGLLKDWTNVHINLEHVENESMMPKEFTFEILNSQNLLLFNLFILTVTPRPNTVVADAVAGKYVTG